MTAKSCLCSLSYKVGSQAAQRNLQPGLVVAEVEVAVVVAAVVVTVIYIFIQ